MYKCKECAKKLCGTKGTNLISHLKTHSAIYAELYRADSHIEYKRHKFLLSCVEMVTVNGRAFRSLTDSSIRSMNDDLLQEFIKAGREVDLKDPHLFEIKELVGIVADKVRLKIGAEAKNRALALMMDIGTKCGRSFLGTSIQFNNNGNITVRSIGIIELKQSHTGIYLADVIVRRLERFEISVLQIVSVTTDNGSNVLKMVRDMDAHVRNASGDTNTLPTTPKKVQSNSNMSIPRDDAEIEREIVAALAVHDLMSDDEALEQLFADDDNCDDLDDGNARANETLLSTITSSLINTHHLNIDWAITGVNCAAHTLQLAIGDAKKATTTTNQNVIDLCRATSKLLRLKSTFLEVEMANLSYKVPRLEVKTRWCSLYLMV